MTDYTVNYNDERFVEVEEEKQQALAGLNKEYDTMINQSEGFYQGQIDASKEWAEAQKQNQQAQTDFAIEKIEQQKDQTKKDYTKEQSGAYVDWQKQSGDYGVNAEQMAAQGMQNTGYAESSQVSMYNTYQNRVATAREAYTKAVLNYDNAIKDAILQNNSALAEIAAQALEKQLQIALEGFQYKNSLILEKTNAVQAMENTYYARYQDVLSQINTENALAEEVRQYNESLAFEREQFAYQKQQDAAAAAAAAAAKSNPSIISPAKTPEKPIAETGVVTNKTGNGWIAIGNGRYTTKEFENMYAHGSVVKQTNKDGSVTYKKSGANTKDNSAYWTR